MKNKTLKENYSGICLYCGKTFISQRKTRNFCPGASHRQMNGNNGPSIPPYAFDEEGNLVEVDSSLEAAYSDSSHLEDREGDWSMGYYEDTLRDEFGYRGPLPVGSEILVAGNYLLQMRILWEENIDEALFWIKPITSLTDEEKATALIKSVHDEHNTDDRSRGNKQR